MQPVTDSSADYTQRMIRNNEWKYIWNTTDIDELYDLRNDPHELYNVTSEEENQGIDKIKA